jgi:ribonuclease HI
MKKVTIYTDGACSKNPGPGGWASVLIYKGKEKNISGYEPETTNNRMELKAVLEAIKALKEPCEVTLHTDSSYLHDAFEKGWIDNWLENGWRTSSKKDVENQDLWQYIIEAAKKHNISFNKVKGHSGDKYNSLCDRLARGEIKKNTQIKREVDKSE